MPLTLALLLFISFFAAVVPLHAVSAQTQYVTATPGDINLGMNTTIAVTAPRTGSYTVVVVKPSGLASQLSETFTSAGQVQKIVFGLASSGFGSLVNQNGTYNVFLEQGATVISSTSFYATNKLIITMDMVNGGTCAYIPGATRGVRLIPRFYINYASNGAPITNTDLGISINFTQPGNVIAKASWDAGA